MSKEPPRPNPAEWWREDQLDHCPRCGEKKLAPKPPALEHTALRICLACGLVPEPTSDA